jgi:cytochrome c-type biogenesis protein CcmH
MNHPTKTLLAALIALPLAIGTPSAQTLTVGLGAPVTTIDPHFHNVGPNNTVASMLFGTLLEQDGDRPGAAAKLEALAADLPAGSTRLRVEAEVIRLRGEGAGPDGDAGQAIAALPEGERQQVIRTMVEQLDARLAGGGGTLGEWQRLIRARLVLQEPEKAREALGRARGALAAEPDSLKVLEALAGEIPGTAP